MITFGCVTASSVAAANSGPYGDVSDGMGFALAALLLVPLGAMITGPLVAKKLRLASWGAYSLSVIAAVVTVGLGLRNSSPSGNVLLIVLVLTAVNLLIGYGAGMRREWPDRD